MNSSICYHFIFHCALCPSEKKKLISCIEYEFNDKAITILCWNSNKSAEILCRKLTPKCNITEQRLAVEYVLAQKNNQSARIYFSWGKQKLHITQCKSNMYTSHISYWRKPRLIWSTHACTFLTLCWNII